MKSVSKVTAVVLTAIFVLSATSAPMSAYASTKTEIPKEFSASSHKDRQSYDKALKQQKKLLKKKKHTLSYEDSVDRFMVSRDKVSRQEIGSTLYDAYAKAGPKPKKKYAGERIVAKEKAEAKKRADKKVAEAAAVKAKADADAAKAKTEADARAAAQARAIAEQQEAARNNSQTGTAAGVVKMSNTGICHAPGTTYYNRTTHFTAYSSVNACLNAGGRLPLR